MGALRFIAGPAGLADCGEDAHAHVLTCPESLNPGDYFSSLANFDRVHSHRREKELMRYIGSKVTPRDRGPLRHLLKQDLEFLDIKI
jgi:hypothetical protein